MSHTYLSLYITSVMNGSCPVLFSIHPGYHTGVLIVQNVKDILSKFEVQHSNVLGIVQIRHLIWYFLESLLRMRVVF